MSLEPEQAHHGHRKTGLSWLDLALALSALLISMTSLIVTIVHSRALERMAEANAHLVEANSWPFLSYDTANGETIGMSIVNEGVGPAKIEAIEVKWAGRPSPNAVEFLKACCGFVPRTANVEYEFTSGQVLRAGQSMNLLKLPHTVADEAAWNALDRARISSNLSVNVCYCSIFDQCWLNDIVRLSLKPRPVSRCAAPSVPYRIVD